MHARFFGSSFVAALILTPVPAASLAAQRAIPTPASILGFEPGADRHLPSWKQIVDYFTAVDRASPRVSVRTLGKTEVEAALHDLGELGVNCDFCGKHYGFDAVDCAQLFASDTTADAVAPASGVKH